MYLERHWRLGATFLLVNLAKPVPELSRAQAPVGDVHAQGGRAGVD